MSELVFGLDLAKGVDATVAVVVEDFDGLKRVSLPCWFFTECESPSKRLDWACGPEHQHDRKSMCTEFHRLKNQGRRGRR